MMTWMISSSDIEELSAYAKLETKTENSKIKRFINLIFTALSFHTNNSLHFATHNLQHNSNQDHRNYFVESDLSLLHGTPLECQIRPK